MVQHIIHGIGQERTTFGDFDRFIYNFVIIRHKGPYG